MTLFQKLATAAGYDPDLGPGSSCLREGLGASGKCVLSWGSGTKEVSSIVLIANGVGFAVCRFVQSTTVIHLYLSQTMTFIMATVGPVGDYRMIGRWLLFISTAICWAAQFASISLTCGSLHLELLPVCSKSTLLTSSEPLACCDGCVHD